MYELNALLLENFNYRKYTQILFTFSTTALHNTTTILHYTTPTLHNTTTTLHNTTSILHNTISLLLNKTTTQHKKKLYEQIWRNLRYEDDLKYEDNLKYEDDLIYVKMT